MKTSNEFLRPEAAEGSITGPVKYEMAEMEEDISSFTEKELPTVRKFLGQESLSPEDAAIFRTARARWWEEKYGFPYHMKAARRETIANKYKEGEGRESEARELQERMFQTLAAETDETKITALKNEYLERYPDQLEGVEAFFGMRSFLELSRKFPEIDRRTDPKAFEETLQSLTESHFVLSHFVATNNKDEKFLELFWNSAEKIASRTGFLEELDAIRSGTLSQVATIRIFQELGDDPRLSHPRDDAYGLDLWSDAGHAVQIKTTRKEDVQIETADKIAFPGVEVRRGGKWSHWNTGPLTPAQKFRMSIERYRERTHRPDVEGFYMEIPRTKINRITGEPDKKLVESVREKIRSLAH
jgi:hypothetical protein